MGYTVASYSYDAWGVPTLVYDDIDNIGSINPLRYRGYFYDNETGFYYVSSRYYDPEIGRWINADSVIAGVGGSLAVGGDFNIIPDSILNTKYLGLTANLGLGTPGGEFHIEWGETAIWNATRFNIFDLAEDVYIKIMEW